MAARNHDCFWASSLGVIAAVALILILVASNDHDGLDAICFDEGHVGTSVVSMTSAENRGLADDVEAALVRSPRRARRRPMVSSPKREVPDGHFLVLGRAVDRARNPLVRRDLLIEVGSSPVAVARITLLGSELMPGSHRLTLRAAPLDNVSEFSYPLQASVINSSRVLIDLPTPMLPANRVTTNKVDRQGVVGTLPSAKMDERLRADEIAIPIAHPFFDNSSSLVAISTTFDHLGASSIVNYINTPLKKNGSEAVFEIVDQLVTTDAHGRFEILGRWENGSQWPRVHLVDEVREGGIDVSRHHFGHERVPVGDVVLRELRTVVSGRIVDDRGNAVKGVAVFIDGTAVDIGPIDATTGRFRFEHRDHGDGDIIELLVRCKGHAAFRRRLTVGADVEVVLARRGHVKFRILRDHGVSLDGLVARLVSDRDDAANVEDDFEARRRLDLGRNRTKRLVRTSSLERLASRRKTPLSPSFDWAEAPTGVHDLEFVATDGSVVYSVPGIWIEPGEVCADTRLNEIDLRGFVWKR